MGITLKNNDIYLFRKAFFKCFSFFSKKRKTICVIQNSNPQNKSRHFTVYFLNFQIVFFLVNYYFSFRENTF